METKNRKEMFNNRHKLSNFYQNQDQDIISKLNTKKSLLKLNTKKLPTKIPTKFDFGPQSFFLGSGSGTSHLNTRITFYIV